MPDERIQVQEKPFLGRVDEQKQFRAALADLLDANDKEDQPYVCLLYGDGGIGKTTLAGRFDGISAEERPFAGQFQSLWVDWEDERKKNPGLQVGRESVTAEALFKGIYDAAIRQKWGRRFTGYRKAIQKSTQAEKKIAEVLTGEDSWDELAVIRNVSVSVLAKIVRSKMPYIGDTGQQLVQTFLDAGVEIGLDQATRLRAGLETYLRARLKPNEFDHFLNPNEQLAFALARGLKSVASKKRLILFLDSYEVVDRADIWLRAVIQVAGPRVIWVIAGRNDLVRSRQFGAEYFKGYADDRPSRLLAIRMRPLAVAHIRTYFEMQGHSLGDEELEAVSRVTRGIPLAVQEVADMLAAGAPLAASFIGAALQP
ncbi:MAG: hypothetical protein ACE5EY_14850, partial [Anaerolineae bacterium]